ncbi:NEL-type E3 ubiquitin ligase domain-containing protein [Pseudomonas sp. Marseille-Q1929]|uniref:NEL-type E3 ubiquitin ligase domain-containing protein n=1 Tax=Pseudomonas sp. Marseille-Q1929 TaxID=2730402 RepID=UPI001A8F03DA|nr:NEL-type E3 ubiquitin ligase domain-containing protein [Pseudomonas sp. Marseille-Q1929]MBO0495433.1 hypothetical protein [Pseudomonas sp. Marseille-Q1929]
MTATPDLYTLTAPMTRDELDGALLDLTGDLDKAQVLHKTLAHWLVKAPSSVLDALEEDYRRSEAARRNLESRLKRLEPLDTFCIDKLNEYLAQKGHKGLDVRHDYLQWTRVQTIGSMHITGLPIKSASVEKSSLVLAAMQNFSEDEAGPDGLSEDAAIYYAKDKSVASGITAEQFVGYCRDLDLGGAYQKHILETFDLTAFDLISPADGHSQAEVDVGHGMRADMLIDLHIARAKNHIKPANYAGLLKLIRNTPTVESLVNAKSDTKPLIWQGLKISKACIWGVLVFSKDTLEEFAADEFMVYMPNEPQRRWYEYKSLEDFKTYLTSSLKQASYLKFFECYLDELERANFLSNFKQDPRLGSLQAIKPEGNLNDFFFCSCLGKIQLDVRVLAVPTAQVDEDARYQRLLDYFGAGLEVLNAAGFFVPVLGQLMLGVAVGQLLGDVYDGLEDWSHGDHADALKHLIAVAQNIASFIAFAVGGRVVGSLTHSQTSSSAYFDKFEAVELSGDRSRLWRPELSYYRRPGGLPEPWVANARGVHQVNGHSYIRINGAAYAIGYDASLAEWRLKHPTRSTAYRPPLRHNLKGGWQHVFERPEEWTDPIYALRRIDPALEDVPSEALQYIAAIHETDLADLQRLALEHAPLPERFQDTVARFKLHQKVLDFADALAKEDALDPRTARTQILALPLMPGWPKERFFELLDSRDNLLESHPDLAPFDYEDQSIHITEQQLRDGQVFDTLLAALSDDERSTLLGETSTLEEAPALLKRRLLDTVNDRHRRLYDKLYDEYKGTIDDEMAPLRARFSQLPLRVARELRADASSLDRRYLIQQQRMSLSLEQSAREVLDRMAEDQALMGLYWPPLAGASTRRLIFGMLARLSQWPPDLLLHVYEGSLTGKVLEQVGPSTASVRRSIVRSDKGFQAFDEKGASLNTQVTGADGLLQAVVDCLSPAQRQAMNLKGEQAVGHLRSQLRFKSQDERGRVARYLWPERSSPEETPSCVQAQLGVSQTTTEFARTLVRKVKRLYPLLDDAHVSAVLEGAGMGPISRARAVKAWQQQFAALRKALRPWGTARVAPLADGLPPTQLRLSRSQVMAALKRAWHGQSQLQDDQGRNVPGLKLDRMVFGDFPVLPAQVNFDRMQWLSLRNMELSRDPTPFLKHFNTLKGLELADNLLSQAPDALSSMPALEHLNLARNTLQMTETMSKTLAQMRTLTSLNLAGNPLIDPPDVSHLFELRELLLSDCRLSGFPEGVRRLPYLERLDLRGNEIKELPEWLAEMPRRYGQAINLGNNPLSTASQSLLEAYRKRTGQGMGYLADDIDRMNEQVARETWLTAKGGTSTQYAQREATWRALNEEPYRDAFFTLLARLKDTADAAQVRADLERRVWRVLNATAADADLRDKVFYRAAMPINCDDAAAAIFSDLEVLVEIHEGSHLATGGQVNARQLLETAKKFFRLSQVESFALAHSRKNPLLDSVQVSLFFRTRLASSLQLPGQPKDLHQKALAGVEPSDLAAADAAVRRAELSPELLTYITRLPYWKAYLKQTFAARFETLFEPFHDRLDVLESQDPPFSDADMIRQANTIMEEKDKVEAAEIRRLTEEEISRSEVRLPSCSTRGR